MAGVSGVTGVSEGYWCSDVCLCVYISMHPNHNLLWRLLTNHATVACSVEYQCEYIGSTGSGQTFDVGQPFLISLRILPSQSFSILLMADPQLLVFGPCKRKDAARFADNGDPGPVSRNKKTKPSSDNTKKDLPQVQHRHPFAPNLEASGDVNITITARQESPQNTNVVLAKDGVKNDDKNPIDVDDDVDDWEDEPVEESADEELGESDQIEVN